MYLRTGQLLNVLHTDFEDGKTGLFLCQTTCNIMPRLLYLRTAGTSNQYHNDIVHTLSSKNIVLHTDVLHTYFEDGKTGLVLCQTTCSIMPRLLYLRIAGTSNQYHNGIVHTLSSKNIVSYVPLFSTRTYLLGGSGCKWLVHEMKVYIFPTDNIFQGY